LQRLRRPRCRGRRSFCSRLLELLLRRPRCRRRCRRRLMAQGSNLRALAPPADRQRAPAPAHHPTRSLQPPVLRRAAVPPHAGGARCRREGCRRCGRLYRRPEQRPRPSGQMRTSRVTKSLVQRMPPLRLMLRMEVTVLWSGHCWPTARRFNHRLRAGPPCNLINTSRLSLRRLVLRFRGHCLQRHPERLLASPQAQIANP